MKLLLILLLAGLPAVATPAVIVNNAESAPGGEDSLCVNFVLLDSLGSPTPADSVAVLVSDPSGQTVYSDSMGVSDSRITSVSSLGGTVYRFADQVSQIDGNGGPGPYTITLTARSSSLDLVTTRSVSFQVAGVYLSSRLAAIGDSVAVYGGLIDSNRTERGAFGIGAGAAAVSLVARDTAADRVIPGVSVWIRNLDQTTILALGRTAASGAVGLNLEPDTVLVLAASPGYTFPAWDTLVVEPGITDTVFGQMLYPDPPPSATLCRVWGYLYRLDGSPVEAAAVSFSLSRGGVKFDGSAVSPFSITAESDSTGLFEVDLIPSDLLVPSGTEYDVTITRPDGTVLRERVTVPDEPVWQLTW